LPESANSSMPPEPNLWITILAGGSGTRFWPVSTTKRPKQLLPLAGSQPLLWDTLQRALGIVPKERIRILTGSQIVEPLMAVLEGIDRSQIMVEPEAKGTAPVLTWAAWALHREDPDAVLVSLHADQVIQPKEAFWDLVRRVAPLARTTGQLFTVAVRPDRPETQYGYIRPGPLLQDVQDVGETGAYRVGAFVEKPDLARAEAYLAAGYLWNSGIFIWRADAFLAEVRAWYPELGTLLPLLEAGDVDGFFETAPHISVDEAILERSERVASVPATFAWEDVGSWEALSRTCPRDEEGNVALGKIHFRDARENIVMVEDGDAVLWGVEGLVVVRSGNVVLVADRARAPELKALLTSLPAHLRDPEAP
jgi:mannose-1-phosphate guanylyltransferase/mannose-6-phosphate isomerase